MLEEILALANVGRFHRFSAPCAWDRLTTVHGPNGAGKTTLVAVLRSLAARDGTILDERRTLGAYRDTEIALRIGGERVRFARGTWTGTAPRVEVFDTQFVTDHVFAAERVWPEQRRALYEIVVGAEEVAMTRRLNELDAEMRKLAAANRVLESAIRRCAPPLDDPRSPPPMHDLEAFLVLPRLRDVDAHVRECRARIAASDQHAALLARAALEPLSCPELPDVSGLLAETVAPVSSAAAALVASQVATLGPAADAWIRDGLARGELAACPFCAQPTGDLVLVEAYRVYFSDAHREHVRALATARGRLETLFGEAALGELVKCGLRNAAAIHAWADVLDLRAAAFDAARLEAAWRRVRAALADHLRRKASQPAIALPPDETLVSAIAAYRNAAAALAAHAAAIDDANRQIDLRRRQAAVVPPLALRAELVRLQLCAVRHRPDVRALVDELLVGRARHAAVAAEKEAVGTSLRATAVHAFASHEAMLNRYLRGLGAGFTLAGTRPELTNGRASSSFQLVLGPDARDRIAVRGTKDTAEPSFRTALSAGDKSTLALAHFFSRLHAIDLAATIVVIDDPTATLDADRTSAVVRAITAVAARAAQTIVLSHDADFLTRIHAAAPIPSAALALCASSLTRIAPAPPLAPAAPSFSASP